MKTHENQTTPEKKQLLNELHNLECQITSLKELNKSLLARLGCILEPSCKPEEDKHDIPVNCSQTTLRIRIAVENIKEFQNNIIYLLKYLEV